MSTHSNSSLQRTVQLAIAFIPWLLAMYVFYWLDSSGTWTADTAHRGKLSVMLLGGGMLVSFLIQSHFMKRSGK